MSGMWAVAVGVAEELWLDIGDSIWVVLEALHLSPLVLRLREEMVSSGSRKRSLVRILGSALPLKPVQRPYLRYVDLRSLSTSCDSLFSAHTQGRIESRWLADTECSSRFRPIFSRCDTAPELFPLGKDKNDNGNGDSTPRSSTPFSLTSEIGPQRNSYLHHNYLHHSQDTLVSQHPHDSFQHSTLNLTSIHATSPFTDPTALAKISALEDELSQLRSQISAILNQTKRPVTPPPSPTFLTAPPPPPPPPPPLPPPPLSKCFSPLPLLKDTKKNTSFSELIAQNKESINKHTAPLDVSVINQNNNSRPVSMSDVLKGLNKVKLKKVSRSPGGTPVRSRPKSPLPGDPASIIAAALKKRFANMNYTPEKDNHDESNEFSSSPENTPQINRKTRSEVPKCKLVEEEHPKKNLFQLLKKSPRIPKPKPKEEEKPSLPIFGQHLLKKRTSVTPEPRDSASPSSEASDLSR